MWLYKINSKVFHLFCYFKSLFIQKYSLKKINKKINLKAESFDYYKFVSGFEIPANSQIFIHAGLKPIRMVTSEAYEVIAQNIINAIKNVYSTSAIFVPTFTPSFRNTRIYSKNYSRAEFGVFSDDARKLSDFRTDDAIHSVAVFSENCKKFINYNYRNTFAQDGFYSSLKENTFILNICTEHFVSTYIHFVEDDLKVPYKKKTGELFKGVMYNENEEVIEVNQISHGYKYPVMINRTKLVKYLVANKVLKSKKYFNLHCTCISVKDLDCVLRSKISFNPYFLVTF